MRVKHWLNKMICILLKLAFHSPLTPPRVPGQRGGSMLTPGGFLDHPRAPQDKTTQDMGDTPTREDIYP